ncbi:MAG: iron ABC transporter permease [Anaerococcus sp.]|nr:iron ABC transporter permease [Anaerococcus sp.]
MNKKAKLILLGLASLILAFLDLFVGTGELGILDLKNLTDLQRIILFKIRLPEMGTGLSIGLILGLSGGLMQTILDNPLASPFTLGISSAAGFGAALFLLLGFSISFIPLAALAFSLIALVFVYFFSKKNMAETSAMILAGIAIKFFFDSLTSLSQYISTDETLSSIIFWLFGSLSTTSPRQVFILLALFFISLALIMKDSHKLTALRFGEDRARAMGIDTSYLKIKSFILVSILASLAVSFAGVIGFIGIIGPHLARLVFGEEQRYFLLGSSLFGSNLLVFSSILSKVLRPGTILPIGIISSLLGLPLILAFLIRRSYD